MSFPVPDPETGAELPTEDVSTPSNFQKKKYVIGGVGVLVGVALIATIGGVCGSGKCKRSSPQAPTPPETTVVAAVAPVPIPASDVPSMSPSDIPSYAPSDMPSNNPSDAPSKIPTVSPTGTPSLRPTVPKTVEIASTEDEETCNLIGCFLRNLDTNTEVLMSLGEQATLYNPTTPHSVRCDFDDEAVSFVEFFVNDVAHHREYNAPYWMESNDSEWIEPVEAMGVCESIMLGVVASADDAESSCVNASFLLMPQCDDENVPSPTAPETTVPTMIDPVVASSLEEDEEITVVGPGEDGATSVSSCSQQQMTCYLVDLDSMAEIRLVENDEAEYRVDDDSRYSVRCQVVDEVLYLDFSFGGETHREHTAPYWMHSNSADWIEPVDSLSVCGLSQDIKVKVVESAEESRCEASFALSAVCS